MPNWISGATQLPNSLFDCDEDEEDPEEATKAPVFEAEEAVTVTVTVLAVPHSSLLAGRGIPLTRLERERAKRDTKRALVNILFSLEKRR